MISVARVINGTSKGIENAPVDMFPLGGHQPLIQVFRIPSLQVADPMNADIIEQKGNSWANARDGCKTFRFHHLVVLTLSISHAPYLSLRVYLAASVLSLKSPSLNSSHLSHFKPNFSSPISSSLILLRTDSSIAYRLRKELLKTNSLNLSML